MNEEGPHLHPAEKCLTIRSTSLPSHYTVPSAIVVILLCKTSRNSGVSVGSSIHRTLLVTIEAHLLVCAVPKCNARAERSPTWVLVGWRAGLTC